MEAKQGVCGAGSCSSSRAASSLAGDRQRFFIELRPGETTIVSWRRLVKDAKLSPALEPPSTSTQLPRQGQDPMNECFQDDERTIKHNGFFVDTNRSQNKFTLPENHQSMKQVKNVIIAPGEKLHDRQPIKHAKLDVSTDHLMLGLSSSYLQVLADDKEHGNDKESYNISCSPVRFFAKQPIDISSIKSNLDASILPLNSKDAVKDRAGTTHCSDMRYNVNSGAMHQKYQDNSSKQLGAPVEKLKTDANVLGTSITVGEKEKGHNELPDLNIPACPVQPDKDSLMRTKGFMDLRPKGTMLERAIKELEKVVAETSLTARPSRMEVQMMDGSSAAIKRRLPREVKQKLAKVARLAQSSQGKISEELINQLMAILGHSVHMRTLKRNLRQMVLLGLSAKREKADRFQQMKREVKEMIKIQQVLSSEEKGLPNDQYNMDNAIEDKIFDLYSLYMQGMDEDKGPQIRKLYVELAELWPNGMMDNHEIKNAIRRTKERRKALYELGKDQEKNSRTKLPALRKVDGLRGEAARPQAVPERMVSGSNSHILALPCGMISSIETMNDQHFAAPEEIPNLLLKSSNMDPLEQEKLKDLTFPELKEQIKQQQRELGIRMKKHSLKLGKEYHKPPNS